jgi:opacity protein-like surface antigen
MKHWRVIAAGLLVLVAQSAFADSPAYNYTELAFVDGQFRLGNSSPGQPTNYNWYQDGYQIDASYALDKRIWLAASYSDLSGDKQVNVPATLRTNSGIIRAGYIFRPAAAISIDVAALWRFDENKQPVTNSNGPGASLGARARLGAFEVFGRGAYLAGEFDGGYSANAGALWHLTNNFAFTAAYKLTNYNSKPDNSDYNIEYVNLGVRFTFPTPP